MTSLGALTLKEISALDAAHKQLQQNILNKLRSAKENTKAMEQLVNTIKQLSTTNLGLIYALSEVSPEINKFFETNPELNQVWARLLQQWEYPDIEIVSFDKKSHVTQFSQFKAALLMNEFQKYPNPDSPSAQELLNRACDLGVYHALDKRLKYYAEKIYANKNKDDIETIDTYVQYILKDVAKLSNLYWAIGSLNSALTLLDIVNYYFTVPAYKIAIELFFMPVQSNNFSWLAKYDDKKCPFPVILLEAAIELLYRTQLTREFPEAVLIIDKITHGGGLYAKLDRVHGDEELKMFVLKKMGELEIPLVDTFARTAVEHAVKKIHEFYPDFELVQEQTRNL